MPPIRSPLFSVPESDAEEVMRETEIRLKAKRRVKVRVFDPDLGATAEEAEERLAAIRNDINLYGEYVYGLPPADLHRLWNRVVDDVINRRVPQNKVLFIAPPNSAKSTWNSLIRPTYHLGAHPTESILFFTSSDPMARTFHSPVEAALRENEKHRMVFPDNACRPHKSRGWSTDGLYLRGTPAARKDPSYKAVGFGATIMGARANGVIIDDPLDQDEAQSTTVQAKAKRYSDQTITPRIQIGTGWMVAVMTRFHEADLGSHYINLAENSGDWIYIRTPLIATNNPTPDPLGRKTGERLWPDKFTEAYVEGEKRRFTIAEFNLVQQGDPTGMGGDLFQQESWFQPLPPNFWSEILPQCQIVHGWDLAFSKNKRSCFTVAVCAAIDREFNMYIIHVIRDHYSIPDTENAMVQAIRMMKPRIVGIEYDKFHQATTKALVYRVLRAGDVEHSACATGPGQVRTGSSPGSPSPTWYGLRQQECFLAPGLHLGVSGVPTDEVQRSGGRLLSGGAHGRTALPIPAGGAGTGTEGAH
jgi:hypothetical protein